MTDKTDQAKLEKIFDAERPRFLTEWQELLRFKSISSLPEHQADCAACAEWLAAHLKGMGLDASLLPTKSKPVVYACHRGLPGKPTVLFYGHYDVMPVDPLDLWQSDPFDPVLRGERMYARGALDDKGQVFYVLKALETLLKNGALDCSVKIILEGEEECGSGGMREALPAWTEQLQADLLMVCDSECASGNIPTIEMGFRGLVGLTVWLGGLKRDLHSGHFGGAVKNPATEMARLLATLHNSDGSIAVPGFYEFVRGIDAGERAMIAAVPFDPAEFKDTTGVEPLGGEAGYTPKERTGFRPAVDVNGIHTGYGGAGIKTIIPSHAIAKLTARLVGGQNPAHCLDLIKSHLKAHAPEGLELKFTEAEVGGPALRLDPHLPVVQRAAGVLTRLFGQTPVYDWGGGSIPIVSSLAEAIKGEALLVGFGMAADNMHAPNESFSLAQFRRGFLFAAAMLQELGR